MIAFISDIHANLTALEAVLADIHRLGTISSIICLGDVVGYGPQPVECLDLTARSCKMILLGNHEHALIHGAFGFSLPAKRAIDWTREAVEGHRAKGRRLLDLIQGLPTCDERDGLMLVHGSPRDHVMEYVLESDTWEGTDPGKLEDIFAHFQRLCFVGHTHRPGVFTEDGCFLSADEIKDGFVVSDGAKYLVNVGSVGQPRDKDPRACYMVYSGDAIYHRRVSYNIHQTATRIRENHRLHERLAARLFKGE